MNLIQTFVRNPVKVTVGVLLTVLFGVLSMVSMPMQLIPDVTTPTLTIDTIWPGASPQEVERVIVQEQEKQLKSVEGVSKMTSESMDSLGRVTLEFPVGTDMSTAEIKVNSRLQQVPFYPEDVKEPVIKTSNASDRPIAWFILMEATPSDDEVRAFRDEHTQDAAAAAPGERAPRRLGAGSVGPDAVGRRSAAVRSIASIDRRTARRGASRIIG
jgi:HAE1 family hydrophobic/amphiphilic exporter-1